MLSYENIFRLSLYWRIVYGMARFVLAIALVFFIGTPVAELIMHVMQHELVEDPGDLVAQTSVHFSHAHGYVVSYFMVGYLLFWSAVDVFLSVSMLKHRLWAFPVSLTLIGVFLSYELYRAVMVQTVTMWGLVVIDVVLWGVIFHEYQRLRRVEIAQ